MTIVIVIGLCVLAVIIGLRARLQRWQSIDLPTSVLYSSKRLTRSEAQAIADAWRQTQAERRQA